MGCGTWCVYYTSRGVSSACIACSYYCDEYYSSRSKPTSDPGKVDAFKLARLLKEKAESKRRAAVPRLSDCPTCHEHSLYYDLIGDSFSCLNLKCGQYDNPILSGSEEYRAIGES